MAKIMQHAKASSTDMWERREKKCKEMGDEGKPMQRDMRVYLQ